MAPYLLPPPFHRVYLVRAMFFWSLGRALVIAGNGINGEPMWPPHVSGFATVVLVLLVALLCDLDAHRLGDHVFLANLGLHRASVPATGLIYAAGAELAAQVLLQ